MEPGFRISGHRVTGLSGQRFRPGRGGSGHGPVWQTRWLMIFDTVLSFNVRVYRGLFHFFRVTPSRQTNICIISCRLLEKHSTDFDNLLMLQCQCQCQCQISIAPCKIRPLNGLGFLTGNWYCYQAVVEDLFRIMLNDRVGSGHRVRNPDPVPSLVPLTALVDS